MLHVDVPYRQDSSPASLHLLSPAGFLITASTPIAMGLLHIYFILYESLASHPSSRVDPTRSTVHRQPGILLSSMPHFRSWWYPDGTRPRSTVSNGGWASVAKAPRSGLKGGEPGGSRLMTLMLGSHDLALGWSITTTPRAHSFLLSHPSAR
jgi:hypothetical protein